MRHLKKGFTLIELLIVVAVLSFAFTGLFHVTILVFREGRVGAEDMTARQQIILVNQAMFKDIKNASETVNSFNDFTEGKECLILKYNSSSDESKNQSPSFVVYNKERDKLIRQIFYTGLSSGHKTTLVDNLNYANFSRDGNLISWSIVAQTKFQDTIRNFKTNSSANLGGGMNR